MSQNFNRVIEVIVGNKKISSVGINNTRGTYIEFDVQKTEKSNLNRAEVLVYNLGVTTREDIVKGQSLILNAGYENDIGAIFIGSIQSTFTEKRGSDFITTLVALDGNFTIGQTVNKSYAPGITSKQLISDLVKQTGLEANSIVLVKNLVYSNGRTIYGKLKDELIKVVNETGSRFNIKNNIININVPGFGKSIVYLLSSSTGLLSTPKKLDDSSESNKLYTFKALLNHNLDVDNIIQVQSQSINGNFRISGITHLGSLDGEFISEVEVSI